MRHHRRRDWRAVLELPGANQMHLARELNDQLSFLGGAPAPELIVKQLAAAFERDFSRLRKTRDCFICLPMRRLKFDSIGCRANVSARFGLTRVMLSERESFDKMPPREFKPPAWLSDWVLILGGQ